VACGSESAAHRFSLTGILGTSFATTNAQGTTQVLSLGGNNVSIGQVGSSNQPLFTGGGALGMTWDCSNGRLRMEVEGRWGDPLSGTATGFVHVNGTRLLRPTCRSG